MTHLVIPLCAWNLHKTAMRFVLPLFHGLCTVSVGNDGRKNNSWSIVGHFKILKYPTNGLRGIFCRCSKIAQATKKSAQFSKVKV